MGYITQLFAYLEYVWDSLITAGFPFVFWVKPRWSISAIPDQTGRVVLVTGGNSGIGYATCKALYDNGATVYMACRSAERADEAIRAIRNGEVHGMDGKTHSDGQNGGEARPKGRLESLELDLADLRSVERFADDFIRREGRLDVLFANAGVMATPEGLYTAQGYTLQFGTNCLGHHRLITLLLPLLRASTSRVIISTSMGHILAPGAGFDPRSVVRDPPAISAQGHTARAGNAKPSSGKYEKMRWVEYGQSKWCDIALARRLHWVHGPSEGRRKKRVEAEQIGDGELISIAVHPGFIATNLWQHFLLTPYVPGWLLRSLFLITRTPADGALNQLWVATCSDAEARKLSGEYVVPFQRIGRARPDLENPKKVDGLWRWCDAQYKRTG